MVTVKHMPFDRRELTHNVIDVSVQKSHNREQRTADYYCDSQPAEVPRATKTHR